MSQDPIPGVPQPRFSPATIAVLLEFGLSLVAASMIRFARGGGVVLAVLLVLAAHTASVAAVVLSVEHRKSMGARAFVTGALGALPTLGLVASIALMRVGRDFFGPLLGVCLTLHAIGMTAFVLSSTRPSATSLSRPLGVLAIVGSYLGLAGGVLVAIGSAWGRPLRIRGRQLHANLREGADWTEGERPSPAGLDAASRAALEALWLHDAQKEHASVPAFSRVSWMLAAVGAPAELLVGAHRAALEEIDHTRRCFALAAGYAGKSFSVEAMPDLLCGGALDDKVDPLATLAEESLLDGGQLEDFNADVAALCARVCEEPATRDVLERIAREERSHAEFSWSVIAWLLVRDRARVEPVLRAGLEKLARYPRPTAVSADKATLVAKADTALLRKHGRISDAEWAEAWTARLETTRARVHALLSNASNKAGLPRAA